MRIAVNLASRPFVELRPLLARLRLVMAALVLLAIGLLIGVHVLGVKARAASAQMQAVNDQTARITAARTRNEARMMQPGNRAVLERAQFLNSLFARKSFSWTAVMMDLERVLPAGVQVTSIEPVISKQGAVSIRLRVTGERDRAIQLVRNLEHSARFVAPRLSGESAVSAERARALAGAGSAPGTTGNPGAFRQVNDATAPANAVEFEIFSGYNPLPEASAAEAAAELRLGKREKPDPDDRTAAPAGDAQPGPVHNRHAARQFTQGGSR